MLRNDPPTINAPSAKFSAQNGGESAHTVTDVDHNSIQSVHAFASGSTVLPKLFDGQPKVLLVRGQEGRDVQAFRERHVVIELLETRGK